MGVTRILQMAAARPGWCTDRHPRSRVSASLRALIDIFLGKIQEVHREIEARAFELPALPPATAVPAGDAEK